MLVLKAYPCSGMLRHRPTTKDAKVSEFLKTLRTTKGVEKVAASGYCYGGYLSLRGITTGELDAAVMCHPSMIDLNMVKAIKGPTSWAMAEVDKMISDSFAQEIKECLTARKDLEFEMHTYPGTVHGSYVRPNLANPEVKAGFEAALKQTVDFVRKHLEVPL